MNGAESLVRTLSGGEAEVCFANPGTSEMQFVAALDRVDGRRCVLGLLRRRDRHRRWLLSHGGQAGRDTLASRPRPRQRAREHPQRQQGDERHVVNIVGDHATYHRQYDAPLTSDIEGLTRHIRTGSRLRPTRGRSPVTARSRSLPRGSRLDGSRH